MKSIYFVLAVAIASMTYAQNYNYEICKLDAATFNMQVNGYDVASPAHNPDKLQAMIGKSGLDDMRVNNESNKKVFTVQKNTFEIIDSESQPGEITFRFDIVDDAFNVNGLKVGDGMQEVKNYITQFCPDRANQRFYTAYGDAVLYIYMDKDYKTVERIQLVDLVQ